MTEKRMLSRREFLIIGGQGAAAAAFLAGCGAATTPAPAPAGAATAAPTPAAPVTVRFLAWGDAADIPAWEQIATLYKERHPNVTVEVTPVSDPNANFYPKLQTEIAGGNAPHISSFQGWEWQTYADRGVLANIDDYVARDNFTAIYPDLETINTSTLRNGKRYLIPMQLATMVMFYVKKHFDAAGMAYPTDDWTFEQFMDMATKLTNTSGESKVFGMQANGSWFRDIHWIRSTGKQEFDSLIDPKKAMFNQPEIVETLQLMASDVYNTLKIAPTAADLEGGTNTLESGNVAMKYEGAWFFGRLNSPELREQGKQLEFDVVLMPQGPDATRPHRGWAEGIALPVSDNVDAAWEVASFMAGEEGDKIYSSQTGRLPNSLALIESFWIPTIQERFGVQNGQAFIEAFKKSEVDVVGGVPRSKMWSEIVKPVGYDPLMNGSQTAAEALPKVDAALQAVLDEFWASS